VAIEASRQFNQEGLEKRLKIAQIIKLESDAAKTRQEIFESIGNMYGSEKAD
jgi:hypothetical protein